MQIDLLTYTPEPLRVLWTATRTCKSPKTPQELWKEYPGDDEAVRLLRGIWKMGHQSIFEHVSLTYAVSGVSRVLLAQYTRHRIGISISVQSARAVAYNSELGSFYMPHNAYPNITEDVVQHAFAFYNRLLQLGVLKEDARYILPQGCLVNFVTTLNLRSLWDIYQKRVIAPGAQKEIKNLIQAMMDVAIEELPWLGELYKAGECQQLQRPVGLWY